jgi:hypothetical protein
MRRRWKWISALILAAVLGCGWWLRLRPSASGPDPIAAAAPAPAPFPSLWPASSPNPAGKPASAGDHSGEIEVCGVGRVKLDFDDAAGVSKYFNSLTKNSRMRWLATLRNSDDYRARATGLYLEGILDRDSPQKDPEAARDELVQLAVGTRDPAAFALAYTKCIKGVEDFASQGACPQLSIDDWARADADNAVPWLQLAAKARRQNNAAAEAAAFAQAAQAHQYESYNWSLFSFAQPEMPDDMTAANRWFLTAEVIGVEAAMPMPYLSLFQYCSRDSLTDPTVHQQCNALAELIVSKATTLSEFSMGKSLGTRVGWPAERLDKLTQELKASIQALNQMTPSDPEQQWSCNSVASGNAFMSQLNELGERGLARQAIERSGEAVAELSRRYDEQTATTMQKAQERVQSQAGGTTAIARKP